MTLSANMMGFKSTLATALSFTEAMTAAAPSLLTRRATLQATLLTASFACFHSNLTLASFTWQQQLKRQRELCAPMYMCAAASAPTDHILNRYITVLGRGPDLLIARSGNAVASFYRCITQASTVSMHVLM